LLLLLAWVPAAGCHQSYREGIRVLCDAPKTSDFGKEANPAVQHELLVRWILARLENPEALRLFEATSPVPRQERLRLLEEAATKAGMETCALLDGWRRTAVTAPARP
jgi:hypothetical protein